MFLFIHLNTFLCLKMLNKLETCFKVSKLFKKINNQNYNFGCVRCLHNKTNFTKHNYNVTRGNFGYIEEQHVTFFRDLLGEHRLVMNLCDLERYNVDWFNQLRGCSSIVLKPKTNEEISKILSFCNSNKLAVCPQGGNTGVVGGATPVFDEIVLSMELMNNIISLDENSGVLVCEAGCILENLNNFLDEKGLIVPLDLGAKGSCHIGGNVATNAGGIRLLRYGNLHGNVLGIEAVKANGEIVDCMSTLRKDNTGFHLKHLFIGSEGLLGVISKVALQCAVKAKSVNVAFLGLQNFEKVLKTYKKAKEDLGEILSAVEVMDSQTMEFINDKLKTGSPIGDYPFYMLIETSGSNGKHDQEKINEFLETALVKHFILNGIAASEPSKVNEIWSLRENIPQGFRDEDFFYYDFTLPLQHWNNFSNEIRKHMGSMAKRVFSFGHFGDGNIHLQINIEALTPKIKNHIEPYIFERVTQLSGSISAEHGIGFLKAKYLNMARPKGTIDLMRQFKKIMDPNGILNPYKMFSYI